MGVRRTPLLRLAAFAALAALPACKNKDQPAEPSGTPAAKVFRAGVVFDVGGADDKSFNEAAYRGIQRAKQELGIDVALYQPSQPADRKTGLRQFAAKDYDVIIGVGFIFTDELLVMAKDFPNLKF